MWSRERYFKGCKTVEETKTKYRKLAMQYHPDKGGDTAIMQQINEQYLEALQEKDGQERTDKQGKTYKYTYNEEVEKEIMQKINELLTLKMQDVKIELIGRWIWISGNTRKYKEELKQAKCKWSGKKRVWYYHTGQFKKRRSEKSMEEIRNIFGAREYTREEREIEAIN